MEIEIRLPLISLGSLLNSFSPKLMKDKKEKNINEPLCAKKVKQK